jgi:hypothetical protein
LGSIDVALKGANAIDAEVAIEIGVISLCQVCSGTSGAYNPNSFTENLYIN